MKLKVGGFYRVAWEGEPRWAVITRIEVFGPGTVKIHYAFAPPWAPRWMWSFSIWAPRRELVSIFLGRMDDAERIDQGRPGSHDVAELEIHYKGY